MTKTKRRAVIQSLATLIVPIIRKGFPIIWYYSMEANRALSSLQAYAICGCYWALPADLAECAKVILEFRPNTPASSYINKGAPSTSGLLTSAISLTDSLTPSSPPGGEILRSFILFCPGANLGPAVTSNSANSGYSSGYSIAVPTISHSIACGPEGCYAHSSSSTASSPSIPSLSFDPSQLTLTGPPQPLGTQTTSIITSVVPTTVTTTMTSPYFEILTYTTQYTTTLYSCDGGCTPPPLPTVAPLIPSPGQASPQVTSTGISTIIVTKTSTITSCAPTLTSCPASLPATSTYTETETRTILSCEGGCTGPAPAGAKDVCVRRLRKRTIVLDGLLS